MITHIKVAKKNIAICLDKGKLLGAEWCAGKQSRTDLSVEVEDNRCLQMFR
jgi:hypothetical protein